MLAVSFLMLVKMVMIMVMMVMVAMTSMIQSFLAPAAKSSVIAIPVVLNLLHSSAWLHTRWQLGVGHMVILASSQR